VVSPKNQTQETPRIPT